MQTELPRILIEVEGSGDGYQAIGLLDPVRELTGEQSALDQLFASTLQVVSYAGKKFAELRSDPSNTMPNSFELSFGLKLSAGGDIWLAKVSSEAQLTVKAVWSSKNSSQGKTGA